MEGDLGGNLFTANVNHVRRAGATTTPTVVAVVVVAGFCSTTTVAPSKCKMWERGCLVQSLSVAHGEIKIKCTCMHACGWVLDACVCGYKLFLFLSVAEG